MKVTIFSNFFNHHQKPVCDNLYHRLGSDFQFVSTKPMPQSFVDTGYSKYSDVPYHLASHENKYNLEKAMQLGKNSDIVVIGAAPDVFIRERVKMGKITFWYAERFLKKGNHQLFDPKMLKWMTLQHSTKRNKKVFMLCASAYTANDLNWVLAYPNKKFKWGYFTEVQDLDIEKTILSKPKNKISMLLVCRLIDWKHPDLALKMVKRLKKMVSIPFELNIVGSGEMESELKQYVKENELGDEVNFLGNIANESVLQKMRESHIFLFTSDRNEGWGAVLNEAMSNGCAVVCSHSIGAAPYLVKNEYNGLIFKSKNVIQLTQKVKKLVLDTDLRNRLIQNAYKTMTTEWSPKIAAENLLILSENLLNQNTDYTTIDSGPCSVAESTSNSWYL